MKKSSGKFLRFAAVLFAISMMFTVSANAGIEDYEYPHYVGVATATVNVREGAGVTFDQVTDASGKNIQLSTGDEVEILEERKADDGKIWYHIAFTQKGVEYIGFSTSSYLAKDNDRPITPTPTPEPEPVVEPEELEPDLAVDAPVSGNAPEQNPTEAVTTVTDNNLETVEETEEEGGGFWTVIWIILLIILIFLGAVIGLAFFRYRKRNVPSSPVRKVDRLKQMNNNPRDTGRRAPQFRGTTQHPIQSEEPRKEVYVKRRDPVADNYVPADEADIESDNEDRKALREKIEHLQEHDLVRHIVYGEGEVHDNSDVKLLEVRFGNDMRFLKKDQLVNKRELVVFDEEDQSIARRRRRRMNSQSSNRNY